MSRQEIIDAMMKIEGSNKASGIAQKLNIPQSDKYLKAVLKGIGDGEIEGLKRYGKFYYKG